MGDLFMNNKVDCDSVEIQNIKKAMKETKNKRMYQRYMVIMYHLQGYANNQIADIMNLCAHTVGTYIKKYKSNGISELEMGHSTGAPRKLTKEQENKLIELITTKTPDEVGFEPRKNWTVAIIKQ